MSLGACGFDSRREDHNISAAAVAQMAERHAPEHPSHRATSHLHAHPYLALD